MFYRDFDKFRQLFIIFFAQIILTVRVTKKIVLQYYPHFSQQDLNPANLEATVKAEWIQAFLFMRKRHFFNGVTITSSLCTVLQVLMGYFTIFQSHGLSGWFVPKTAKSLFSGHGVVFFQRKLWWKFDRIAINGAFNEIQDRDTCSYYGTVIGSHVWSIKSRHRWWSREYLKSFQLYWANMSKKCGKNLL